MTKEKRVSPHAIERLKEKSVRSPSHPAGTFPSWRFSAVDEYGSFPWPTNTDTEKQILQKLRQFDSMTWHEIQGKKHHLIHVNALSKEAKARLMENKQDDIDELFSFHFNGSARIIGIKDSNVIKLLWWDPKHQVCPSPKRHT